MMPRDPETAVLSLIAIAVGFLLIARRIKDPFP